MKKLLNDGLDLMSPEGHSLMENTPFGGFSAGLHRSNRPATVGGIPLFGRLAVIFAGLEFAGLPNWQRFTGERPSYASR